MEDDNSIIQIPLGSLLRLGFLAYGFLSQILQERAISDEDNSHYCSENISRPFLHRKLCNGSEDEQGQQQLDVKASDPQLVVFRFTILAETPKQVNVDEASDDQHAHEQGGVHLEAAWISAC